LSSVFRERRDIQKSRGRLSCHSSRFVLTEDGMYYKKVSPREYSSYDGSSCM
jgi:hypothetical protein